MTTYLGCIADDFTGATDLAGLLARSGIKVSLRIGVPQDQPSATSAVEVIALKCRTSPVAEAVSECRQALGWLRAAGAKRFFWKYCSTFDSTAQGNIGPVSEALMKDLGVAQTLYCPAFPENGRTVFMGTLFVGRLPLAESPMKDHPLTPMRDSNLLRLLSPQVSQPVGLIDRVCVAKGPDAVRADMARLNAEGVAHVVVDAVANEDLATIAAACHDMPLITGGSAIAMPLAAHLFDTGRHDGAMAQATLPDLSEGAVILSGSCSQMTNRQVATYLATGAPAFRLDPRELAEQGVAPVLRWLAAQALDRAPLIYATADPDSVRAAQDLLGKDRAGALVEDALAACAVAARDAGAGRIIVAGGETSGAVVQALGVDRLYVGREIAPGVPWTFCDTGAKRVAMTLKSGNFGSETFFLDALAAT